MGLQSSRYKEQMYNYWIIIREDGKRFPPPRITRLKGKIRWDDDRTQYFSFPNIEQFVPTNTISIIEVILFGDSPVKDVNIVIKTWTTCFMYGSTLVIAISVSNECCFTSLYDFLQLKAILRFPSNYVKYASFAVSLDLLSSQSLFCCQQGKWFKVGNIDYNCLQS